MWKNYMKPTFYLRNTLSNKITWYFSLKITWNHWITYVFSHSRYGNFFAVCGYGYSRLNFHSQTVSRLDLPTLIEMRSDFHGQLTWFWMRIMYLPPPLILILQFFHFYHSQISLKGVSTQDHNWIFIQSASFFDI